MARRIRWQILIAAVSSLLVLALMSYLAITTAAVQRPVVGGDYVEGLLYTPQQLNPLISDPMLDPGASDIQALVFEGLVRTGDSGLPEPGLASSWEIDDTGQVYTFTLRTDVSWHDGRPLTVDDVLFTVRAIQGPAFTGNPSVGAVWRTVMIDKIDQQRVRCRLRAPYAAFLDLATFPILPAHVLGNLAPEQWSTAPFSRVPVGTGPYEVREFTAERVLLGANPDYYAGRSFIDSIELRFFDSPQTALNALVRGEIQGLGFLSTNELRTFNMPRTIERHAAPLDSYTTLTFNLRDGPLTDQGVRRALATGLDRQLLIDQALDGQGGMLDSPILPGWWAAAPDAQWYGYDQERAAALLDDLDYQLQANGVRARDSVPLVLPLITDTAPDRVAAAEEIARQWAALGVTVEVEQLESQVLQERLIAHDFVMAIHGWQRLGADPDVYELWHGSQAETGRNYAGLQDSEIDQLLDSARQESDLEIRAATYAAFQRRWIDLAPSIPLFQPLLIYATTAELGGVDIDAPSVASPSGETLLLGRESRFRHVMDWYLRSAREIRGDLSR